MKNKKGFTLVEAVVVAVIVAILAAVGIPVLSGYLRDAELDNARGNLELIGAAVMQTHNRGTNVTAGTWATIGITDPSDGNWDYTFGNLNAVGDPSNFAITASGDIGTGTISPNQPHGSRWTGIFEYLDE